MSESGESGQAGREPLSHKEEHVLSELESHSGGMRIETVAERLDFEYSEAKSLLHDLSDKSLVVSGPGFTFEADRDEARLPRK